jgi:hypothetical protein
MHVEANHVVVIHNDRVIGLDKILAAHVNLQIEHVVDSSGKLLSNQRKGYLKVDGKVLLPISRT